MEENENLNDYGSGNIANEKVFLKKDTKDPNFISICEKK